MQNEIISKNPQVKENFFKEIIKFTLIAFIIVYPIKKFIVQPFIVSGPSMDPTFATGQYLVVDQLSYHFHTPKRYDVIILRYPNNPKVFYIKRIIGLPGETVTITNGKVRLSSKDNPEGIMADDSFVSEINRTSENYTNVLNNDQYFVLGDNRAESSDSRVWGPLESKYIVGRPLFRLFPFDKISYLPGEDSKTLK